MRYGKFKKAGSHLARKLKRYKIKPGKIRFGDDTAQGYYRSQFDKAWERYLPASGAPSTVNGTNGTDGTDPQFTREDDVPTSDDANRNVPTNPEKDRNTIYEGKTPNVPSVPSVPSNLEGQAGV